MIARKTGGHFETVVASNGGVSYAFLKNNPAYADSTEVRIAAKPATSSFTYVLDPAPLDDEDVVLNDVSRSGAIALTMTGTLIDAQHNPSGGAPPGRAPRRRALATQPLRRWHPVGRRCPQDGQVTLWQTGTGAVPIVSQR